MAHMIESMFSVREAPWHRLGRVVQHAPSAAEAIRLAGLDWPVELQRLSLPDGRPVNRWAVIRTTDNAVVGDAVGPHWRPLQNADAFAWFDPFVTSGQAHFQTAGSLCGGRRVWVLAELSRDPVQILPGDTVRKFLLLSNSHDGSLAVRVGFTPVRVVCANTLAMAHGNDASKLIRIRHTAGLKKTLGQVQEIVNAADAAFEATAEQYRALARRQVSAVDLRRYVQVTMKLGDEKEELSSRGREVLDDIVGRYGRQAGIVDELLAADRADEQAGAGGDAALLDHLVGNFEAGRGSDLAAARGSWWSAYNAVTEYLSHGRGRTEDGRLNALWFGESARLNAAALQTALAMSA